MSKETGMETQVFGSQPEKEKLLPYVKCIGTCHIQQFRIEFKLPQCLQFHFNKCGMILKGILISVSVIL